MFSNFQIQANFSENLKFFQINKRLSVEGEDI